MTDTFQSLSSSSIKKITKKSLLDICKKNKLYQTPHLNDVLYLHYQGFGDIENLDEYTGLKCLWLECNAISEIKGLDKQSKLKCLFLQNNLIKKIENLEPCKELDNINLANNHIVRIENCGIDILPDLTSLNLCHNCLRSYENLKELINCKKLSVCDLSNNRIEDILVVKIFSEMPELRVLVLQGNPVVNDIPQYRKTLILECQQLTYLDSRPVFPRDRACAEAWKRGGYAEERREHARWNKEDRKRIRDSVNATLRLRNRGGGEPNVDLIPSSDDDIDDQFERSSAPPKRDSDEENIPRGINNPPDNVDGNESSSSESSEMSSEVKMETEPDELISISSPSVSDAESSKSKIEAAKGSGTNKKKYIINSKKSINESAKNSKISTSECINEEGEDILDTAYVYHNLVEDDFQKLVIDDVDMNIHRKDNDDCYKRMYNNYIEYVNEVMEINENMEVITVNEIVQIVKEKAAENSVINSDSNINDSVEVEKEIQNQVMNISSEEDKEANLLQTSKIIEENICIRNESLDNNNEEVEQPIDIISVQERKNKLENKNNDVPGTSIKNANQMDEDDLENNKILSKSIPDIVIEELEQTIKNTSEPRNEEILKEKSEFIENLENKKEEIKTFDISVINSEMDEPSNERNLENNKSLSNQFSDLIMKEIEQVLDNSFEPKKKEISNKYSESIEESVRIIDNNLEYSENEIEISNVSTIIENINDIDEVNLEDVKITNSTLHNLPEEDITPEHDIIIDINSKPHNKNNFFLIDEKENELTTTATLLKKIAHGFEEAEGNIIEKPSINIDRDEQVNDIIDEIITDSVVATKTNSYQITDYMNIDIKTLPYKSVVSKKELPSESKKFINNEKETQVEIKNNTQEIIDFSSDISNNNDLLDQIAKWTVNIEELMGDKYTYEESERSNYIVQVGDEINSEGVTNLENETEENKSDVNEINKIIDSDESEYYEAENSKDVKIFTVNNEIPEKDNVKNLIKLKKDEETDYSDGSQYFETEETISTNQLNGDQKNLNNNTVIQANQINTSITSTKSCEHSTLSVHEEAQNLNAIIDESILNGNLDIDQDTLNRIFSTSVILENSLKALKNPQDQSEKEKISESDKNSELSEVQSTLEICKDQNMNIQKRYEFEHNRTLKFEKMLNAISDQKDICHEILLEINSELETIKRDCGNIVTRLEKVDLLANGSRPDNFNVAGPSGIKIMPGSIESNILEKEIQITPEECDAKIIEMYIQDQKENKNFIDNLHNKATLTSSLFIKTEAERDIAIEPITEKEKNTNNLNSSTQSEEITDIVNLIDKSKAIINIPAEIIDISNSITKIEITKDLSNSASEIVEIKDIPNSITIEEITNATTETEKEILDIANSSTFQKEERSVNPTSDSDYDANETIVIEKNPKPKPIDLTEDLSLINIISLYLFEEDIKKFTEQYGTTDYKSMLNHPRCLRDIQSILNLEMLKSEKSEKKDTLFFAMQKIQDISKLFRSDYD